MCTPVGMNSGGFLGERHVGRDKDGGCGISEVRRGPNPYSCIEGPRVDGPGAEDPWVFWRSRRVCDKFCEEERKLSSSGEKTEQILRQPYSELHGVDKKKGDTLYTRKIFRWPRSDRRSW
jgi:hypothetical protein